MAGDENTGLAVRRIAVLQPVYRPSFNYQCEGLATVRGGAAGQVRFAKGKDSDSGMRHWQRQETIYNLPTEGRIWLSTTRFDILRVETDLREPAANLAKDHLLVDYGPVRFTAGADSLWLPWRADMYPEQHGKRYHHYLTKLPAVRSGQVAQDFPPAWRASRGNSGHRQPAGKTQTVVEDPPARFEHTPKKGAAA